MVFLMAVLVGLSVVIITKLLQNYTLAGTILVSNREVVNEPTRKHKEVNGNLMVSYAFFASSNYADEKNVIEIKDGT